MNIGILVKKINRVTILTSQAAEPAVDWLHVQQLMQEGCTACAQPVQVPRFCSEKFSRLYYLPYADMKHHPNKVGSQPDNSPGLEPYMFYPCKTDGAG